MSGAETFPGEATLPKSVIALAFDRVLNPIRSAATGLFLDVTAIVEQAQIDKKRKETPAATEASVKRSRAVDTVPASGKNLPTDVAEMPPPPIPTRTAARAQERGVKQETQVRSQVKLAGAQLTLPAYCRHGTHTRDPHARSKPPRRSSG